MRKSVLLSRERWRRSCRLIRLLAFHSMNTCVTIARGNVERTTLSYSRPTRKPQMKHHWPVRHRRRVHHNNHGWMFRQVSITGRSHRREVHSYEFGRHVERWRRWFSARGWSVFRWKICSRRKLPWTVILSPVTMSPCTTTTSDVTEL